MTPEELRKCVAKVRTAVCNGIFCSIQGGEDVKELKRVYPKLYGMVTSVDCDVDMLNQLVSLVGNIRNGTLSQEDADICFGQKAADKYVIPLVEK